MVLYSTMLDIDDSLTKEKFVQLVIKWNQESRHEENVIPGLKWDGKTMNVKYESDECWLDIEEYRNGNTVAVRYEKVEDNGRIWNTDYVVNFNERKILIQLDRSFEGEANDLDFTFSTPYFLTLLIDEGYLKGDEDLPVAKTPVYITEDNVKMLARVINGESTYRLPVVYVSRTVYDQEPVDVNKLSNRLKGVAHVLVQQDRDSDKEIRKLTNDKNEYFGAVGIYYPNKSARSRRFLYRNNSIPDRIMLEKIIRTVMSYCNCQQIDGSYTWDGVMNSISRDRLISQRQERVQAETERDQLYDEFDDELKQSQKRIDALMRENNALRAENAGLNNKLSEMDEKPVIIIGNEEDLYPGEIKEMVLSILDHELKNCTQEGSRRGDVLTDIINNNDYKSISQDRKKEIQKILGNYNGMNTKVRKGLQDFGFEIEEDGKHYRLTYFGDERYKTTLAKTPSDNRGGQNIAHEIQKAML